MKFNAVNKEKGIALLITVIILSVVILAAAFIAVVSSTQLKLASDIADSTAAIYAADSGIEWQLYQIRVGDAPMPSMSNGASISTTVIGGYPNFTVKALGAQHLVKREFEISF